MMDAQRINIEDIKRQVNLVDLVGRRVVLKKRGPDWWGVCPFHRERTPSFKVDTRGFFKCHGCGAGGDAITFLMRDRKLSFKDAARELASFIGHEKVDAFKSDAHQPLPHRVSPKDDQAKRKAQALVLWNDAKPAVGTIVEGYLEGRGLALPRDVDVDVVRFLERCPFSSSFGTMWLPAMIALMRDAVTNEPCGIHRTALEADGSGKCSRPEIGSPRKMLGPAKGAVVKLITDENVDLGISVAEGLETALTAIAAGWSPVWACGSAGSIASFPVLASVEAITIFTDNDKSGAGYKAARECAVRWQRAGREAIIFEPIDTGADLNDLLRSVQS